MSQENEPLKKNFEFGNDRTSFTVEFGKEPSFHISTKNSKPEEISLTEWANRFLVMFGNGKEIKDLEFSMSENFDSIIITGSFGSLEIDNVGDMELILNNT